MKGKTLTLVLAAVAIGGGFYIWSRSRAGAKKVSRRPGAGEAASKLPAGLDSLLRRVTRQPSAGGDAAKFIDAGAKSLPDLAKGIAGLFGGSGEAKAKPTNNAYSSDEKFFQSLQDEFDYELNGDDGTPSGGATEAAKDASDENETLADEFPQDSPVGADAASNGTDGGWLGADDEPAAVDPTADETSLDA